MKLKILVIAVVFAILLADVWADEQRVKHKRKRVNKRPTTSTTPESVEALVSNEDVITMMEADDKAILEEAQDNEIVATDPCLDKHCGAGQVCDVNKAGVAECICIPQCPEEIDPRRKVCTNHNETFNSDCDVYQMRCRCDRKEEACLGDKYKHVHIEYYGTCRDMPACSDEEKADFPRRMRDWLFNIMRDLADRHELSKYYLTMQREAETNLTRRWSNAAVWKWCDLDGHPHDRTVSRHELFPIRAPLMALEHCIAPFLDGCDVNDDHRISLQEWGKCLELDQDDLEDRCEEIREADD